MSPSNKSLLTSKVLQRLPIISNALRRNSNSSSRKEDNAVVGERNLARLGNGAAAH